MVIKSDGKAKINNVSIWTHIMGLQVEGVWVIYLIWRQEKRRIYLRKNTKSVTREYKGTRACEDKQKEEEWKKWYLA